MALKRWLHRFQPDQLYHYGFDHSRLASGGWIVLESGLFVLLGAWQLGVIAPQRTALLAFGNILLDWVEFGEEDGKVRHNCASTSRGGVEQYMDRSCTIAILRFGMN